MAKPVTILGGGLAGLTLGIGLRQRGVPVTLHEAGNYPRHRVCGEFISGRGQATLTRLGLRELFDQSGAVRAETSAFFSENRATAPRRLPSAALCLSRYALDAALAMKFFDLGGELRAGERSSAEPGEGIVRATGRRAETDDAGARWFGLKIHARNVPLVADLEMHISSRGYVGLCRVNDGEINICGLFRKARGDSAGAPNGRELLRGPEGSPLRQRLKDAEFVEDSFCAVAGLSLRPQSAAAREGICLGDAITMIPPVTGNGMSMAFESAEIAIAPLAAWSRGETSWETARQTIARACDTTFARRLVWAQRLQRILLTPAFQPPLLALARYDWFWRMAFERTR